MKEIEIKIKIDSREITLDMEHKGDITLNEFCNILDGLKTVYVSAVIKHCQKNNIDVEEFVQNKTLTEFNNLNSK